MPQRTRIYDHRWDPESDETTPADALGSTMCKLGRTEAGTSTRFDFDIGVRANIRMAGDIRAGSRGDHKFGLHVSRETRVEVCAQLIFSMLEHYPHRRRIAQSTAPRSTHADAKHEPKET